MGWVRSVIQISQTSEEFFLVVQGICRFVLDAVISEKPLKINKICIINISDNLLGRYNIYILIINIKNVLVSSTSLLPYFSTI